MGAFFPLLEQIPPEKESALKGKNLLPHGSKFFLRVVFFSEGLGVQNSKTGSHKGSLPCTCKFFPFRVDPFSEGQQGNLTELSPLKIYPSPLKIMPQKELKDEIAQNSQEKCKINGEKKTIGWQQKIGFAEEVETEINNFTSISFNKMLGLC